MTTVDPDQLLLFPDLQAETAEEVDDDGWKLVIHAEAALDLPSTLDPKEVLEAASASLQGLLVEAWVRKTGRGARRHHFDQRYGLTEAAAALGDG